MIKNMRDLNKNTNPGSYSWIITLLMFGILCVGIGFVVAANFNVIPETRAENVATTNSPQTLSKNGVDILLKTQESFRAIVSSAKPAVVTIETKKEFYGKRFNRPPRDGFHFFDPFNEEMQPESDEEENYELTGGSGFFVSSDGYILTNNHVVNRAVEIKVIVEDQNEYEAELVGTDPMTDVALLKITDKRTFPYLEIGNSANTQIGDWVIAIGSPMRLAQTVTVGVISGKNREDIRVGNTDYKDFIQTDAAINFGNSGGPLLDIYGRVIGINTAIAGGPSVTGIGFAIPSNLAKFAFNNLKAHGEVIRGWIGVTIQRVDSDIAASFGLEKPYGALINTIVDGDPADKAGLRVGDLILELDDVEVPSQAALSRMIAEKEVGTPIKVKALRGKKEMIFNVIPSRREADVSTRVSIPIVEKESPIGLTISEITEKTRARLDLPEEITGILVTKVKVNSNAADKMIFQYDVISEVDDVKIKSIAEYEAAMDQAKAVVLFKLYRQNNTNKDWTSLFIAVALD